MKYIGYYNLIGNEDNRNIALSAVNKINYILEAIANTSKSSIQIISPCRTINNGYCKGKIVKINTQMELKLFSSFGRKNVFIRVLDRYWIKLKLLIYILRHIQKNEFIFVYHSPELIDVINITKKLLNYKLILEMEELYTYVLNKPKLLKKELYLCKLADAFIFPTQLLDNSVNSNKKPSIIIHGTYRVERDRGVRLFDSDHVHCVYAGTLDPRKGGSVAVAAAEFLPANYQMHIIGFGNESEVDNLQRQIKEISKRTKAFITYDGVKSGEEYIRYIQSCDIGLSPQNPDASYNDTSFPSKILSYLANGLHVVSIRIPAIEQSAVGGLLNYYDKQEPKLIADTIKQIDLVDDYDSRLFIEKLSVEYQKDMARLFEQLSN